MRKVLPLLSFAILKKFHLALYGVSAGYSTIVENFIAIDHNASDTQLNNIDNKYVPLWMKIIFVIAEKGGRM